MEEFILESVKNFVPTELRKQFKPQTVAELELHAHGLHVGKATDFLRNYPVLAFMAENHAKSPAVKEAQDMLAAGEKRNTVKQFLVKLRDHPARPVGDALWQEGERLLPIIQAACGEKMLYYGSDLWYVLPYADRPREWSQNWHRDPESSTVVKVMAYFWEVTEESGPLQYIQGSHSGAMYPSMAITGNRYASESEVLTIADSAVTTLCVPAGTLAFVNTTGLHRGGYCKSKPRLSATWTFVRGGK